MIKFLLDRCPVFSNNSLPFTLLVLKLLQLRYQYMNAICKTNKKITTS